MLLIILLTAVINRNITRSKTWYSFCISWTISCISYTLLTFAGQQTEMRPDYALCLIQGGLVYAAPPLTGATTLALAIHTFLNMRYVLASVSYPLHRLTVLALLIIPWLIWAVMIAGALVWGSHFPNLVVNGKNGTYCHYRNSPFSQLSSFIAVGLTVCIVAIESVIVYQLYRNRRVASGKGYSMGMPIRVIIFSFMAVVALALAIAWLSASKRGQEFEMILAILPVAAGIIFGSQRDFIQAWSFWKGERYRHVRSNIEPKSELTMSA